MNSGQRTFSLDDLEQETGFPQRKIRHWIQEGVLPPAIGKSRGAYYVQEHLDRLGFLRRVMDELGYKHLPVETFKGILEALESTGDPDLIRRVAAGEESLVPVLVAVAPSQKDAAALAIKAFEREVEQSGETVVSAPPIHLRASASPSRADERAGWTTIEIQDGLELRLRCDEPERVAWLARLARKLREWIREDES